MNDMKWLLRVLVLICFFAANINYVKAEENKLIPSEAVEWNGQYYMYYDNNNSSWEEAKIFCENLGGHLATITSEEENKFLYSYVVSLGYKNIYFGMSDVENEGEWEWVTKEPFIYSNWNPKEPNNDGNEDYGMFYQNYGDGTWNDGEFGDDGTGILCEWDYNKNKVNQTQECFEKRGLNYYYTGAILRDSTYSIPGTLIIDKPMQFPQNYCYIDAKNITVKSDVILSLKSRLLSEKNFKITSNGRLNFYNGGEILSKENFMVSDDGMIEGMNKVSKIQIEKDFIYNSETVSNVYDGIIVVGNNINLFKNFNSLKNNVVMIKNKVKHKIIGDKSCTIENLDLSDCYMGEIELKGKCSIKNISFPIVTTKPHEDVVDLFSLNPVGGKRDEILDGAISSVLYSIVSDKSLKKDLLKNMFSGENFEGIATFTSEEFSIPVLVQYKGKYECGFVRGNLTAFGVAGFGKIEYSSSKRNYSVIYASSKKITDKVVKNFLNSANKGAKEEIQSLAKDCFISYASSGFMKIFDVVEFKNGTMICRLIENKLLLEDFQNVFKCLWNY